MFNTNYVVNKKRKPIINKVATFSLSPLTKWSPGMGFEFTNCLVKKLFVTFLAF